MMDTTNNGAACWIAGYTDYRRDVVGAADTTRSRYLPTVQRFIAACSGPDAPDWTGLSIQLVTELFRGEATYKTGVCAEEKFSMCSAPKEIVFIQSTGYHLSENRFASAQVQMLGHPVGRQLPSRVPAARCKPNQPGHRLGRGIVAQNDTAEWTAHF